MKNMTDEDFLILYYEPGSDEAGELRRQLEASPEMEAQYQAFAKALDQMKDIAPPALAPSEKVEQFEAAWAASARGQAPWYINAFNSAWRTATVFVIGMICGVAVTMNAPAKPNTETAGGGQQQPYEIVPVKNAFELEQFDNFQTVRGVALEKVYSNIENPVMVIDRSQPEGDKKVIYGTSENGAIQVVLNL